MNRLARILNLDDAAPEAPKWNKVFVAGTFHRSDFPDGRISVGIQQFEQMIANWKKAGGNALPVDRHHWGDSNDTRVRAEDKGAVGWIENLRVDGDGDLEGLIAWNDDGRADILADRLRYFSPSFHPAWPDRATGKSQGWTLFGGGLLNDPYLTELPRMAASTTAPPGKDTKTMKNALLILLAKHGVTLSTDASDDAVAAAIGSLFDTNADAVKMSATLKVSADALDPLKVQLAAKETLVADLTTKLAAANESATKAAADAKVAAIEAAWDKLLNAHEVVPAKKDAFTKIALAIGVADAVSAMGGSKVVPVGEAGTGSDAGNPGARAAKDQLTKLAADHSRARGIALSQAMREVQMAHPELVQKADTKPAAEAKA